MVSVVSCVKFGFCSFVIYGLGSYSWEEFLLLRMVLSISTLEKVVLIPGCLPGGVRRSSSRLLLGGGQRLSCRSTVCTVCTSGGGVCSLIRVSFGSFGPLLRLRRSSGFGFGSV